MTPRVELLKIIKEKGFDPESHVAGEAWIDDSLGAILRKLKELGIDDNTLVIFAPDHGRDGKASVFSQGSCQVPMIMRWPKGIAAGQVCEELVQNIDLVPTFFELGKRINRVLPNRWAKSHPSFQKRKSQRLAESPLS